MIAPAAAERKLDGLSGKFETARRLFFPFVQSDCERAALLFVFDPSPIKTDITFRRYRRDGSLSGSARRTVTGGGFVMETAADLLGSADDGEQGYIKARAERPLLGFAFLRDEECFAALAVQTPYTYPNGGSLYAPHFKLDRESHTTLYLLSAIANLTMEVRIRAFDNHGNPLGEAERELLPAAGQRPRSIAATASLHAVNALTFKLNKSQGADHSDAG